MVTLESGLDLFVLVSQLELLQSRQLRLLLRLDTLVHEHQFFESELLEVFVHGPDPGISLLAHRALVSSENYRSVFVFILAALAEDDVAARALDRVDRDLLADDALYRLYDVLSFDDLFEVQTRFDLRDVLAQVV